MSEEIKDLKDIEARLKDSNNSYITKEDFLKMMETLKFTHIEYANIYLITGYLYNAEDDTIKRLGFKIEIE